jgi:hypothetical protein
MATGQGGILSALLLFAILFRLGLLQEPIYDAEYRRVNDLSSYACNANHISKFDYVLSGLTVSTSDAISNSKLKTKTYMKAIKDSKMYCLYRFDCPAFNVVLSITRQVRPYINQQSTST